MKGKTPKIGIRPKSSPEPIIEENVESIYNDYLSWHIGVVDLEGPWGFNQRLEGMQIQLSDDLVEQLIELQQLFEVVGIEFQWSSDIRMGRLFPHRRSPADGPVE